METTDRYEEELIVQNITSILNGKQRFNTEEKEIIRNMLINAIIKYDIIQPFLDNPEISEIMINGLDPIYVEEGGMLKQTLVTFSSMEHIYQFIQKIATEVGREINLSHPIMDARLKDGSRVNVVLNPIALKGPVITIRKFNILFNDPDELVQQGMFNEEIKYFLEKAIRSKYNIFICGGTGSGKTTLLNCMTSYLGSLERIVIIEDASEINTSHVHNSISLETRTSEKSDQSISMSVLIRNALRMRPDRILVGEVRGNEVIDMLQAMNTGHDGSISTGHSNSPYDMLTRLEVIASSFTEINHLLIRRQIISAIDFLIFIERLPDGSRKVTNISEVMKNEDDYKLNSLYQYNHLNQSKGPLNIIKKVINLEKMRRHGFT